MARIQWQRFAWASGADEYTFEVTDGGLYGSLATGGGRKVTLPMVAWEGMLDSIAMARKGKAQTDRLQPDRAFARWSDQEVARLEAGFRRGQGIAELSRQHNRSQDAVEHQLVKLGLWNRFERRQMSELPPYPTIEPAGGDRDPRDIDLAIADARRSPGPRSQQAGHDLQDFGDLGAGKS